MARTTVIVILLLIHNIMNFLVNNYYINASCNNVSTFIISSNNI